MKVTLPVLALLSLFVPGSSGQESGSATRILTGQIHSRNELGDAGNWWGVCAGNPGRVIPLKLKPASGNAGLYEVVDCPGELVFWISGLKQIREGEIPAGVIRRDIWPGGQAVDFAGKQFVLSYERSGSGEELVLSSEGKTQTLYRIPKNDRDDWSWSIAWSGDLDDDGRLDLLVYTDGSYRLYTSAQAEDGRFVKESAVFERNRPRQQVAPPNG